MDRFTSSVVSYPNRGPYRNSGYRGNTTRFILAGKDLADIRAYPEFEWVNAGQYRLM